MSTAFPAALDTAAGLKPAGENVNGESQALNNALDAIVALETLAQGTGYKIARGVHQQAAAQDTIVTGLATVVAVVVSFRDTPTLKQMFCYASIGNQAGAPAAGSFLLNTKKPTGTGDVTPIAATDFTDNINFNWIAVGT